MGSPNPPLPGFWLHSSLPCTPAWVIYHSREAISPQLNPLRAADCQGTRWQAQGYEARGISACTGAEAMAKSPHQARETTKRGVGIRRGRQPDTDPTKTGIPRDTGATRYVQSSSRPRKKCRTSSKKKKTKSEMFIPTWHHFPALLVAGHSWIRWSPSRGDHISSFTPRARGMFRLQTGLSKPSGPRATAAICEGRGLQGRQSGRRGSQQPLGAAFGMEPPRHPLPGAWSCRGSNCKADLCRTDAMPRAASQAAVPRGSGPFRRNSCSPTAGKCGTPCRTSPRDSAREGSKATTRG